MIERLEIIKKRYDELNAMLLDPEILKDVKKTTELSKEKFNESSGENIKDIISLFYKKCDLYQNIINKIFNEFEELISLIQTERCGILKDIDDISNSCNDIWISLLPNDSKEYQKNIGEPISKFRNEMNSMAFFFIIFTRTFCSSTK